jgi:SAM-dependent methyltransferase
MSLQKLLEHRKIWTQKTFLRKLYQEAFFTRLSQNCVPGPHTLEVGGGPGFYKAFGLSVISSDLILCPWNDVTLDGEYLPFRKGSLDNIVGIDFLHHTNDPLKFLAEGSRSLRSGGRLIMIEPWITPFSYLVNRYFMPEDLDLSWRPGLHLKPAWTEKEPFEGNGAVPYILFSRHAKELGQWAPGLKLINIELFTFLSYLCSFGFRKFSLFPGWLYSPIATLETLTIPLWRKLFALKAMIVMEKI